LALALGVYVSPVPPPVIATVPLAPWVTPVIVSGSPSGSESLARTPIPVAPAAHYTVGGVATDLEREHGALTDQLPGEGEDILDAFLGQDRSAGCDAAHDWNVHRLREGIPNASVVPAAGLPGE